MRNQKMYFKTVYLAFSLLLIIFLFYKVDVISFGDRPLLILKSHRNEYFDKWNECVARALNEKSEAADSFWKSFASRSQLCDRQSEMETSLKVIGIKNYDEWKYVILPVDPQIAQENVFVTLGIGHDISAEKKFQKKMSAIHQNVTFYGADPMVEANEKLFSEIGKFFPFAVGGSAGISEASVLVDDKETYKMQPVVHVDIYYFLSQILKLKFIDYLWMDIEYAEYDILDMFYRNGPLDQLGITFCQMSLEVHNARNATDKEMFQTFIRRVIKEKRYGFFYSEFVGHQRTWLFNFEDYRCVRKFLRV